MNDEQDSLGGGGFQPVASSDNNTWPTSRPADDKRLAEVENNGEINAKSETERVDLSSGVTGRTLASSDTDTEPDSRRKATSGNGDAGAVNNLPHVASDTVPRVANKNVLPFATRGTVKTRKQKRKPATRGKSAPVVEAGKGSKGTWQFRLRWNSEPGRPVVYIATVTDDVYDLIRSGDYESWKQQTIASYQARTLSASHTA